MATVFGVAFFAYALIGWLGAFYLDMFNVGDGTARVYQAYGVLFSRDPHVAALGFIWMPLPALSNLPFILLLKPFGLVLGAGALMGALYTAFAMAQLYAILARLDVPAFWRIVWLVIFGAHPVIVQNAAYGLSEAPLMAFLFLSFNGLLQWESGQRTGLHWAGIGAALAILCRYEALAWVAAGALLIALRLGLKLRRGESSLLEANLLTFLVSPVYAVMLWVFVNWQIMGNPIHFLVGPGSTATTPDTAQAVGPTHPFAYAQSSLAGSTLLMLRQIGDLEPLLIAGTLLLVAGLVWKRNWIDLAHLALAWSILGFTFLTAFRGLLPYFVRYFFWIVPGSVLVAAVAQRYLTGKWLRQPGLVGLTLILLAPGIWIPARALQGLDDPYPQRVITALLTPPETTDYRQLRGRLDEYRTMAAYLNSQSPAKLTLIDSAVGGPLCLFLDHPDRLVTTPDRDFRAILVAPAGRADQILVPYPSFDAKGRSDVLKIYPDLYNGAPWVELVREFEGTNTWRLYKVRSNP